METREQFLVPTQIWLCFAWVSSEEIALPVVQYFILYQAALIDNSAFGNRQNRVLNGGWKILILETVK